MLFYIVETSRTSQKFNSSSLKSAPFQGDFFLHLTCIQNSCTIILFQGKFLYVKVYKNNYFTNSLTLALLRRNFTYITKPLQHQFTVSEEEFVISRWIFVTAHIMYIQNNCTI